MEHSPAAEGDISWAEGIHPNSMEPEIS